MTKTDAPEEISIRRAKGREINQVVSLTIDAFSKEIGITGLDVKRLWRMANFYRSLSYLYPIFDVLGVYFETILVAVTHGSVAGEIHLVPHGKGVWSLDSAAVDARFRGRGIYRSLLKKALEYISDRHGKTVVTSLWTTNIAPVKVTNELKFDVVEKKSLLYLENINAQPSETKANIYIRNVKPADAQKIREVRNALHQRRADKFKDAAENHSESVLQRFRNKLANVNSREWIMELEGKVIGYAKFVYTSTEEAANIESFYVLPSERSPEHVGILLKEVLAFLKRRSFEKVTASVNNEWEEATRSFENSGFRSLASIYEMVKVLPSSGESIE